jgi:hypothetical protein
MVIAELAESFGSPLPHGRIRVTAEGADQPFDVFLLDESVDVRFEEIAESHSRFSLLSCHYLSLLPYEELDPAFKEKFSADSRGVFLGAVRSARLWITGASRRSLLHAGLVLLKARTGGRFFLVETVQIPIALYSRSSSV